MLLSRKEFDQRRADNNLRIALIGMSNIGKSHWTRQIASNHGFKAFEVDKAIQEQLSLGSISDAANWMGQPYEKDYQKKAKQYLDIEGEQTLLAGTKSGNLILDTTGSITHLSSAVQRQIKSAYLIVYLEANNANIQTLIDRFSTSPKPLIWGRHYRQNENTSQAESLIRSYPKLLSARAKKYVALSDVTVNVEALQNTKNIDFLKILQFSLS